jgi:hypothetical protein
MRHSPDVDPSTQNSSAADSFMNSPEEDSPTLKNLALDSPMTHNPEMDSSMLNSPAFDPSKVSNLALDSPMIHSSAEDSPTVHSTEVNSSTLESKSELFPLQCCYKLHMSRSELICTTIPISTIYLSYDTM